MNAPELDRTMALRQRLASRELRPVRTRELEEELKTLGVDVSRLGFLSWLIVNGHDPEFPAALSSRPGDSGSPALQ